MNKKEFQIWRVIPNDLGFNRKIMIDINMIYFLK